MEVVTVHPPTYKPTFRDFTREDFKTRALMGFAELVDEAEKRSLKIAVENTSLKAYPARVNEFLELFSVIKSKSLGLTLDVGHAFITQLNGGDPLPLFLEKLREKLFNVHLHDNRGRRDEHLPLGTGLIPLKEFIQALINSGYTGPLIFEHPSNEAVLKSREWLLNLLSRQEVR